MSNISAGQSTVQLEHLIMTASRTSLQNLLGRVNLKTHVPAMQELAMKADLRLSWAGLRELKLWLRQYNIVVASEQESRKVGKSSVGQDVLEAERLPFLFNEHNSLITKPAAIVYISDLRQYTLDLLEEYDRSGKLHWHEGQPQNEIWLKFGGDKGGGSFKFMLEVVNTKAPNSKHNTLVLCAFEATDSAVNLHMALDRYKNQIETISRTTWRKKKLVVYLFGDYEFLSRMLGISGASGRHPCIWCSISSADMKTTKSIRPSCDVRTLEGLQRDNSNFVADGGHLKKAKHYNNAIDKPFFAIPITSVCPPTLHISLGIWFKLYTLFEEECRHLGVAIAKDLALSSESNVESRDGAFPAHVAKLCEVQAAIRRADEIRKRIQDIHEQLAVIALLNDTIDTSVVIADVTTQMDELTRELHTQEKLANTVPQLQDHHNPLLAKLDQTLQDMTVRRQAYYSNTFVGNHVHKCLKAMEVQYFGASALHTKISRYWFEVHPEQYDILRTQLFRQCFVFGTGARIVLTRLCIALSSFALNTMPEVWPDAVKGIIDTFQQTDIPQLDATHRCTALLELLTILPEEFHTSSVPQGRRSTIRHELENGLQHVMPLLKSLLEQQDSPNPVRHQAVKCFSSWLQLNVPLNDIEPIMDILFQLLQNQELFDLCIDSLISVVCQPIAYKYPLSIRKALKQVLQLQDHLTTAVQDKDMDVVQGICRLAVSLGENNSRILLESKGEDRQHAIEFTNLIIGFTALPGHYPVDETISNIPFGFWYILQDDIVSSDSEEFQEYIRVFAPVYMHLVEVMLTKVQYPPDEEYNTWNAEEKEHFRCYRQDIGDTLMYCFTLLREPLLNHLYVILSRIQDQQLPWQQVEACLFAFRSIAEGGDYGDDQCVSDLLRLLAQVNMSNTTLASTALYMLGAYSEWLADTPEALGTVIPVLLSGLSDPELAAPATMSLKDICSECRNEMKPFAETILNTSQDALSRNCIKARESVRLMSIVGIVLSTLSLQDILHYLQLILTPQLQILESAINEQRTPITKSTILLKLNMLSNLCSTLDMKQPVEAEEEGSSTTVKRLLSTSDQPQPVLLIVQQTLPILQNLLSLWISDVGVVEAVCEMLRRASRTLLDDLQPMVPQLAELIATIYNALPHSSILDLARQIIILFGNNEDMSSAVGEMFVELSAKTISLFPSQAREQTDLVETFMGVCANLLKKHSSVFVCEGCNAAAIFQCGLMSITLPENPTVKSTCNFFVSFIVQSENLSPLTKTLTQHGRSLVELVLKAIGGAAPRTVVESLADVIFALNKHCFTHLSNWFRDLMLGPDLTLPRVTKDQREQFVKTVLRSRVNKRQVRDIVTEFSLMCRGLHGTEYAEY